MDSSGWDERYAGTELVWSAGPNVWVEQHAAPLRAGRALDLGAGEGRHALWLAERGWTVTAVDFSQVGLDRVRALAEGREGLDPSRVRTVRADLADYVPERGSYDLVVIAYMHLPVPARRVMLARAADALAPGGSLLVIGHDRASAGRGVGGPPDPDLLWTVDEALADLSGTGLTVDVAEQTTRIVTTDEGEREAVDTALIARRPSTHTDIDTHTNEETR
jgi:SAM-dependent methyltransferase